MKHNHITPEQKKKLSFLKLSLISTFALGALVFAGCGNGCGQTLECSSANMEETEMHYMTVPMCGGCFTSEWGCNSCLWGENCVTASMDTGNGSVLMCSEYYYGDSCLGCGTERESIYMGGYNYSTEGMGCFWGSTASESEYVCGALNGCVCAGKNEGNEFAGYADAIEYAIEMSEMAEMPESCS